MFVNRVDMRALTKEQVEQKFSCDLSDAIGKTFEYQRFFALNFWLGTYPALPIEGETLSELFDRLAKNAPILMEKYHDLYATLNLNVGKSEMNLNGYRTSSTKNESNMTMCLFDSPLLRIDAKRIVSNTSRQTLQWINLTFFVDDLGSANKSVYYFNYTSSRRDQKE